MPGRAFSELFKDKPPAKRGEAGGYGIKPENLVMCPPVFLLLLHRLSAAGAEERVQHPIFCRLVLSLREVNKDLYGQRAGQAAKP